MTEEISADGLAALAQAYATGIVFVTVEVFLISKTPRVRMRGGIYSRASGGAVGSLAFPAFVALPWILGGLVDGQALGGARAAVVRIAGWALWLGALALLIELISLARAADRDGPRASDRSPSQDSATPTMRRSKPRGRGQRRRKRR
ncbi:hypothetical protein Q6346_04865 [Isoptericola sp. b490]|uniref:hypothetical protein n=1 Tax=Actinotalea lenta TaxID=3064654 RepID=UPI002714214C|nr:hypothetical protein [Isoptericola sp. b490]MDO8120644.1 hypothetical protein [Isoptericola sp. b490]